MAQLTDSIQYLDLTGLQTYDALIKGVITAGDEANTSALNAVKGTLSESDSKTLEAINDELDGIDSALSILNGGVSTAGSVAKAVKDGIDAVGTGVAQGETGKAITSITQTNGVVVATAGNIAAGNVTVDWGSEDPVSTTANVQAALDEIHQKLEDNAEAGEVAFYDGATKVSTIGADGKTYTLKQGNTTIATMNFAKDKVVEGGSVVTATSSDKAIDDSVVVGEKYIKLTLANSTDVLYIAVKDLYDDYTFTDTDEIDFTETNNEVSGVIKAGSIAENKLTTALQNKINSAATVVNAKGAGHVQVTVTPASGSTPAEVTITENDIASAQDLSGEVTRAQSAEGEIAGLIGLTGAEGAKAYATNIGKANVVADMNEIDSRLDALEGFVANISSITSAQINGLFSA